MVDFEYAAPNPAAFDIANHFHEWTANYHTEDPHILIPSQYPSPEERRNFYKAYLAHANPDHGDVELLDKQVGIWSPASHAMWAIWGLVQAREDLENRVEQPEFDYVGYSLCRIASFRKELGVLGL